MTIPGPGLAEQALMERTLALCDEVTRFLERTCGTTPAEIDLVGVGLLTRAAHRGLTPEARMCELQALVRRWVHDGSSACALPRPVRRPEGGLEGRA